jgi:hypothetical protein
MTCDMYITMYDYIDYQCSSLVNTENTLGSTIQYTFKTVDGRYYKKIKSRDIHK